MNESGHIPGREATAPAWTEAALLSMVVLAVVLRIVFWRATGLTLEDSLITARYAENLAAGRGFVYNVGERVMGTTTPLWTLILAAVDASGIAGPVAAAKALGILLDASSLILLAAMLRRHSPAAALLFAAAFAASPEIVPAAVSGMETPLMVFAMSLALWGLARNSSALGIGLAFAVLTRIDGALFAGILAVWAVIRRPAWGLRQALLAAALCLPWFLFAAAYFGNPLPQSLLAKHAVYSFGTTYSSAPFLNLFTPFLDDAWWKALVKTVLLLLFGAGLVASLTTQKRHLPVAVFFVAYCALFMTSGVMVFSWYLVPPRVAFWLLVATGTAEVLRAAAARPGWRPAHAMLLIAAAGFIGAGSLAMLPGRVQRAARLQRFEEGLRKPIGLWLRANVPAGARVLLEPIGYIGYYAGPACVVRDEVGLVAPEIPPYRMRGPGWYGDAVADLEPEFLVQYADALLHNRTEGTGVPLFRDETQRARLESAYDAVLTFRDTVSASWMDEKERSYVILRRRSR